MGFVQSTLTFIIFLLTFVSWFFVFLLSKNKTDGSKNTIEVNKR